MPAQELPLEIERKESEYGKAYGEAMKSHDYEKAERMLLSSWGVYPEPKHLWSSSKSLIKDIINFYLDRKSFQSAENWAGELFKCNLLPNDPKPYIILGKIYFESGRMALAEEQLVKAYEMGGRRGYVGEDPKYIKFVLDNKKKSAQ
ncbi:hypothetical protein VC279_06245 [Xanthomonas sp. WHRI 10064A]|uniref:hypothetical protein n=1 Tax=unclassified Xanthomonas TaxID=2643310 RepID=UPI002B221CFC|nr:MULTISPECIES: hypothetical protein [unclassified Xanthomonas]MEA9585912.1 hypothetical protein [Xanthomonas sp. WHRI 10064B]MEA9614339.1 hypothetical protein [Xanthomonas sp. WHRI 10064A]